MRAQFEAGVGWGVLDREQSERERGGGWEEEDNNKKGEEDEG